MRVKARWFRAEGARDPKEVGGAAAFIAFRVAQNVVKSMRKAGFDIDIGPGYFEFLGECLAFAIQVACRAAFPSLPEAQRMAFATELARRAAGHFADNQSELLGQEPPERIEADFIERLNRRFAEYADFGYGPHGPDFAFHRYFASLLAELVPEKDRRWTHDQVIAIEGPEAAATLGRSIASLLETGPGNKRRIPVRAAGE